MKRGDVVRIEWIDSVGDNRVWIDYETFDFDSYDSAMLYKSIGYFVRKTSRATYICQSLQLYEDCGGANLGHLLAIPNKAILSINEKGETNGKSN